MINCDENLAHELDADAAEVVMAAPPRDEAIRKALDRWAGSDPARRAAAHRVGAAWRLSEKANRTKPRRRRTRRRLAIAASLALLLGSAYLFDGPMHATADLIAGRSAEVGVALHPGVLADLDALTALKVEADGNRLAVEVLRGGVFLAVDPTAALHVSVLADGALTRVTGTAFSVEKLENSLAVSVAEGAVETTDSGGQVWSLTQGQQLRLTEEIGAVTTVKPDDVAAWRDGYLVATEMTLEEVVRQLDARHAGVIILADDDLAQARVTGAFLLDDPIEALRTAAATHGGVVTTATPFLAIVR